MAESLELLIGRLDGRLEGIGREIGEIKKLVKRQMEDCVDCKSGINTRFKDHEKKINEISGVHVGDAAVANWFDNNLVRIGIVVGATSGIISIFLLIVSGGWS